MIKAMEITSDVPVLQTVSSFGGDVMSCDFGAKFNLATGSGDKTVRVLQWHVGSGYVDALYSPIVPHKYAVTSVRFSPQGTMLATASIDGTAALWNVATGVRIATFVQPTGSAVRVCRFSPDSTLLATADDDSAVALWDLVMRNLIRTFQHHEGSVQAISFTPDASYLLTTCTQGVLKLWEVTNQEETGSCLASVDDAHDLGVMGSDFSAAQEACDVDKDVYLLATCGNDNLVKLWLASIGRRAKFGPNTPSEITSQLQLTGHSSAVSSVRFSPSGAYLASTSIDKTTRIWEMGGTCLAVLEGHARYATCCAFSRDGSLLATGSNDKTLIVWDLSRSKTLDSAMVPPSSAASQMALAECASNCESEAAVVKHAEGGVANEVRLLQRIGGHDGAVNSCHFHGNKLLATGCGDKLVRLFSREADIARFVPLPISPLEGHRYAVNEVAFSTDAKLLASCSLDGTTIVWDTESGRRGRPSFQCSGGGVRACRFSPDGHLLVTAGDDNCATVFNSTSMAALASLVGHGDAVGAVALSPDSQYLATAGSEGNVKLWSVAPCLDQSLLTIDDAHDLGVQSCDFSPAEAFVGSERRYLLATCGNDSLAKLWTISAPRYHGDSAFSAVLKRSLAGHGGNVVCVRFAPAAGDVLASTATDHTARLWDVHTGECVHVLEHDSMVTACAFSQDSSLFATGSLDKTLLVWELPSQLVFQTAAAVRLRGHRKRLVDWSVTDVEKWLARLDMPDFGENVRQADLTGERLVSLSQDEVLDALGVDDEGARHELSRQLFWAKREDAGAFELPPDSALPDEFLCPITHEVMREPVTCADGFTYERAAINEWFLSGKFSSPMTNAGLVDTRCVPNVALRARICTFLYGDGE